MRRLTRIAVAALALLGALVALVSATPLVVWWGRALADPWTDGKGDILIVLAGDKVEDGMIGYSSFWRSVYAVRAWREGGFRQIVLSGERGTTEPMRLVLVAEGVPAAAIRIEDRSHSTRESALFTAQLLAGEPPARFVLLTSDFHMRRAWRAFRKAGVPTSARPFPDAIKRGQRFTLRWVVFTNLVEETVKIAYYRARGWM
jgi:uncharacterized SAM-binding protein YcdF (DUF218 family)